MSHGAAPALHELGHAETECAARLVGWPAYPRGGLTLNYLHRSSRSDSGFLACFSQVFVTRVPHHSASDLATFRLMEKHGHGGLAVATHPWKDGGASQRILH
jgi:hypothetical protein